MKRVDQSIPKKQATRDKYVAIHEKFKQHYNIKRIRYDDVVALLMKEFFIYSSEHIEKILRMDVEQLKLKKPDK